ncbi:sigma-54-dependent Fis family transcriptional regulator [Desulfocicer niacini]
MMIKEINRVGAVEERLRFETMLAELSTRFINLEATKIDTEIVCSLKQIVEILRIDRSSVAEFNSDKTKLRVTHAYAAPGVPRMPDIVINKQLPWYKKMLYNGRALVIDSPDDLPDEAWAEKAHFSQNKIKSSVLIPLAVAGTFLGVLGFVSVLSHQQWNDKLLQRFNLLGQVFANALMRKRAEEKLYRAFAEINQLKEHLEAENTFLKEEINLQHAHGEFIGQGPSINKVLAQVEQVAVTDSTVLILGETGTGKELLAQAIHNLSRCKNRTMITLNCAALPSNLVESELFGHEKGAYTGAQSKRIGRFELAHGSSLFLDEIGELPLDLQSKLLRVLQQKQFERLGGHESIISDVRIIAATNRNLMRAVETGEFRMDLYYRLNVFPITIPPLRERREDIPSLIWFFVKYFCEKMGKKIDYISNHTMKILQAHHWPGNVRELKNIIERAVIISPGNKLKVEIIQNPIPSDGANMTLNDVQKEHIVKVLKRTNWRVRGQKGAAEILDMKPSTLESRMMKLGIKRPSKY